MYYQSVDALRSRLLPSDPLEKGAAFAKRRRRRLVDGSRQERVSLCQSGTVVRQAGTARQLYFHLIQLRHCLQRKEQVPGGGSRSMRRFPLTYSYLQCVSE